MFDMDKVPHNGHIHFCCHGHLITGYTTEDELFSPNELKLRCKCGELTFFSISKTEISERIGHSRNIERIVIGTHGVVNKNGKTIKFNVYDITRLGFRFKDVILTCESTQEKAG